MLPFVSLGQGGATLVGAVIIAELYWGKIRFEWAKSIELAVARAVDITVVCKLTEKGQIELLGAAKIDAKSEFQSPTDHSYATVRIHNRYLRPEVLEELMLQDEYGDLKLETPDKRVKPWNYHSTLNRLNSKVENVIIVCAIIGTVVWAFGDQFVQWASCT